MSENKKAASGAGNTTDSKTINSMASVAQQGGEVKYLLNAAQKHNIRLAVKAVGDSVIEKDRRISTLAHDFDIPEQAIRDIVDGKDNDSDFFKPVPPALEKRNPVKWTDSMVRTLKNMLNDGCKPAEIARLMHLDRTQVVTKINTLKRAAEKVKKPAPEPEKPDPAPVSKSAPQVKTVPEFDLTAVKKPISKHQSSLPYAALKEYRLFDLMQKIMAANRFTRLTLTAVNEHGTQYRAEVRKP